MEPLVLLIDSNPAVQAIASLALSQLNLSVQTLASRHNAFARIAEIKPQLILFAHDDNDPSLSFNLCKQLKQDATLRSIPFVLLVRAEDAPSVQATAKSAGISDVLLKPFKSDQLQNAVQRLLGLGSDSVSDNGEVLLVATDPLLQKLLKVVIERNQIGLSICETTQEANDMAEQKNFAATLFEASLCQISQSKNQQSNPQSGISYDCSWINPNNMGKLAVIYKEGESVSDMTTQHAIYELKRPLSYSKLCDTFDFLFSVQPHPQEETHKQPLEPEEQSILAARISASIFELLLNQNSLRSRDWESASDLTKNEVLRVCDQFQKLYQLQKM